MIKDKQASIWTITKNMKHDWMSLSNRSIILCNEELICINVISTCLKVLMNYDQWWGRSSFRNLTMKRAEMETNCQSWFNQTCLGWAIKSRYGKLFSDKKCYMFKVSSQHTKLTNLWEFIRVQKKYMHHLPSLVWILFYPLYIYHSMFTCLGI